MLDRNGVLLRLIADWLSNWGYAEEADRRQRFAAAGLPQEQIESPRTLGRLAVHELAPFCEGVVLGLRERDDAADSFDRGR